MPEMMYARQNGFTNVPYRDHDFDSSAIYHDHTDVNKSHVKHAQVPISPTRNGTSKHQINEIPYDDLEHRTKRGPFKDPQDRAQTAQTRKDNACVRCRMQRIRVNVFSTQVILYTDCYSASLMSLIPKACVSPAKRQRLKGQFRFLVSDIKSPI